MTATTTVRTSAGAPGVSELWHVASDILETVKLDLVEGAASYLPPVSLENAVYVRADALHRRYSASTVRHVLEQIELDPRFAPAGKRGATVDQLIRVVGSDVLSGTQITNLRILKAMVLQLHRC